MLFQITRSARLELVAIEGALLNESHFTLPFMLIVVFELKDLVASLRFELNFIK